MYEVGDLVIIKRNNKINYTDLLKRASNSVGIVLDSLVFSDYIMYLVHFPELETDLHFYGEELEPLVHTI